VDATIIDGSANAIAGNAVFDALALKAPLISPSFTTPTLGAATATTINKVTITAPATGATLTIADGTSITTGLNASIYTGENGWIITSDGGGIETSTGGGIYTSTGGSIETGTSAPISTLAGGSFATGTGNLQGPNTSGTVALINPSSGTQTFTGSQIFSSTTRPTSSGTGTPDPTSLITLTDAVDFIATPNNIILRDDFISGGSTTGIVGDLGWFVFSSGGGTGASITGPLLVFPNIGARILTCGNATNAGQVVYLGSLINLLTYANWELCFVVKLNQTTDCDLIVGLTKDNGAIGIGKFGGISFGARYSSATDTDFMFYSKNTNLTFAANDANNYAISSGVAAGTTYNTFRIRSTVAGALQMSINGGSFVAVDTSSITTSGVFIPFFYIATRTTTSKSIDVDFFSMKIQGVAR
jgi:hypothetical protein